MRRLLLTFLLLFGAWPAWSHPLLQNSMWVVFGPDRIRVAVNVSLREMMIAEQLKGLDGGSVDAGALEAAARHHGDYLLKHLSFRVAGRELPGEIAQVTPPVIFGGEPEQTFYQYELGYSWPQPGTPPAMVTITQSMLNEWSYSPGQRWDVTYALRLKRSDVATVSTGLLRPESAEDFSTGWTEAGVASVASKSDRVAMFGAYLGHGLVHILTGWDHLLFVSALVLATATFWEMFKVIAAFTLAHTLTLATSVLTGFRLPDSFVEPVIAGSIVFVAVENLLLPQRSRGWMRLSVAFGFGLVHGLGFAGGLRDAMAELGTSTIVIALLAFSLGVELGHQAVVLPTFAVLRFGDWKFHNRFRAGALRYGSALISLAGTYYLIHALLSR